MNCTTRNAITCCLSVLCLATLTSIAHAQWTVPTDEELKMTSQPQVPGAAAVYLNKEEILDDRLFVRTEYIRIKVLNEAGKQYADIELDQFHFPEGTGFVDKIEGRTIHSDGTIVPLTGKPLERLVRKRKDYTVMEKVVTMPSVEVGSIIEFRYTQHIDKQSFVDAPDWYIQSKLFTRKAHYFWKPFQGGLSTTTERGYQLIGRIAWTSVLPKDAEFKNEQGADVIEELTVHNVMPLPDEEFMPPIQSLSYHVLFFYTPYKSIPEYWDNEGTGWAKARDKFIGPGPKVKDAVKGLVAASDSDDQKLRKLYAAVMQLDNTAYTRRHSIDEDKSEGLHEAKSTRVDGKEQFFDPGQRYCPYGHLAWKHTIVQGVRETDAGSEITTTSGEPYTWSSTDRIAYVKMDERGTMTGVITMTWSGSPALQWRQNFLSGDMVSLQHDLQTTMEGLLPIGLQVTLGKIDNLEDYEQALTVSYDVQGQIATSTGKRLLVPDDIFEVNSKPTFPHEKRELAINFDYPEAIRDKVRISFPATLAMNSLPQAEKIPYQKTAIYSLAFDSAPTSITVQRDFIVGKVLFPATEYPEFRGFYNKFESKDQESMVLNAAAPAAFVN
jgi:Domain of Unknown Function with PDB structure (DUF3857)